MPFSLGRLTAITRNGHSVDYTFDRFGRTIQDGELTFTFDKNGNRTGIGYPGGVTATYDHDFADRETSLSVTTAEGTTPVVTSATYLPSGPLTSLTFGTGATETRTFTPRYFPDSISLDAAQDRAWTYTTDAVGNILRIEETAACPGDLLLSNATVTGPEFHQSCAGIEAGPAYVVDSTGDLTLRATTRVVFKDGFSVASGGKLVAGVDPTLAGNLVREYQYQDIDYFLTSATGPWGSLGWSYDRIGNRLTETDNGLTDTYSHNPNAAGGNTALLTSIALGVGGTRTFSYSPAGHQIQVNSAGNVVDFTFDDTGRMAEAGRSGNTAAFLYDGRSYLRQAGDAATVGTTTPTYDSGGLLHSLLKQPSDLSDPTRYVILYLAGRPVGQVAVEVGQTDRWQYITADHLGTPLVTTAPNRIDLWLNRLTPFGADSFAGSNRGALANEVFLRLPGQWEAHVWHESMEGARRYYNVHRWYAHSVGRYTRGDPLGRSGGPHPYVYGGSNPLRATDPLGLFTISGPAPGCAIEYIMNQVPELVNHPTIPGNLARVTGCSLNQVEEGLRWGRGPAIRFDDLEPGTAGLFDPRKPQQFQIDRPATERVCDQCACPEALLGLGISVLHEYAHQLYQQCNGFETGPDVGNRFEDFTYGPGNSLGPSQAFLYGCP